VASSIILPILSTFNAAGVRAAQNSLTGLSASFGGVSKAAAKAGFALAAFQGVVAGVGFAVNSVAAASALERNMNALGLIFGSTTPKMQEFARSAQSMGLSTAEAAKASTFLGSVLRGAGFSAADAATQTQRLVGLASDLATVYGYDVQEALTGMTALFRGEYDPIEKFGVAMKQAEVNAVLASKGLGKLTGQELLNAQQQVRLELLYQRTAAAQGAFAKQSGTLFVEQKKLEATFKNIQAAIGEALIPVLSDLATQMAKGESLYGTNPDYERRAKSYDEQEAKLKGDDDKAMWKALMHAGIGMMSGKSPNFMSNLASGVTAGAEDYEKTQEDIEAKKARLGQLRDALGDAKRQERLMIAKYGADSVQASKASDKALALEAARLRASRGEKELSAEVQGQANAVRALEVPSTIAMHEAAAVAQLANAAESAYKSSPEGRKKEELRGVSADIHDANAVITSSNATEEDKAQARLRLSTLESRLFELTGVKPTPPATTSITPESKGYLPFSIPTDVMGLLKKHLPTS